MEALENDMKTQNASLEKGDIVSFTGLCVQDVEAIRDEIAIDHASES
jgi:hypothetical protein